MIEQIVLFLAGIALSLTWVFFYVNVLSLRTRKLKAVVIFIFLSWPTPIIDYFIDGYSYLEAICYVFFNLLYIFLVSKDSLRYKLSVFMLGYIIAMLADTINTFLIVYIYPVSLEDVYANATLFIAAYLEAFMLLFSFYYIAIRLIKSVKLNDNVSFYTFFLLAIFPCFQLFAVLKAYVVVRTIDWQYIQGQVIELAIISIFADILIYYAYKRAREKDRLKQEYGNLLKHREMEFAHVQTIIERENKIKKIFHDINNNLAVIKGLISTGNNQETVQFTEKIIEKLKSIQ